MAIASAMLKCSSEGDGMKTNYPIVAVFIAVLLGAPFSTAKDAPPKDLWERV
jgi:hypothetical protein